MSAAARRPGPRRPPPPRAPWSCALASAEARRLLRNPLLWVGVALAAVFAWATMRSSPDDWSGARYQARADRWSGPLLVGHLDRWWRAASSANVLGVAAEAPRRRDAPRPLGRLVGAAAPVVVVALLTAVRPRSGVRVARRLRPRRRARPHPARALHPRPSCSSRSRSRCWRWRSGAAAGRRLAAPGHRDAAAVRRLVPVRDRVLGLPEPPGDAVLDRPDPAGHRARRARSPPTRWTSRRDWLLVAPGEYQDHWARQFVSGAARRRARPSGCSGSTCLFLAVALPRGRRTALLGAGRGRSRSPAWSCQYVVIP